MPNALAMIALYLLLAIAVFQTNFPKSGGSTKKYSIFTDSNRPINFFYRQNHFN